MYLFLQNARATLIPTIAVPVVLLGTFGILAAFGFSINTLTMFGMALSIGLLVDDAIVVVENVERVMVEEGLDPREATRKSMDQITGALVAIALVLAAVFVPMAFFGGSIGVIYRQFSITLVSAMALSVLVALVLTPALVRHHSQAAAAVRPRGAHGLLQVVQPLVRPRPRAARRRPGCHAGAQRPLHAGVPGHRAADGLAVRPHPEGLHAQRRHGLHVRPGADAARRFQGTHLGGARQGADLSPGHRRRTASTACSPWPASTSPAPGQNSGLLFIKLKDWDQRTKAIAADARLAGARQQVFLRRQGGHHHRRAAAGGARARQHRRLRHDAAESRRPVARGVPGGAQPAAGRGRQGSAAGRRAAQRRRGRAAVQARHRSGEGQRARRVHRRHQPDAADRLGVHLRERLHRPRPRQARLRAGRHRTRACSPRT